jgi:hypothetical protein
MILRNSNYRCLLLTPEGVRMVTVVVIQSRPGQNTLYPLPVPELPEPELPEPEVPDPKFG